MNDSNTSVSNAKRQQQSAPPQGSGWQVHKFGGTSLRDADAIARAAAIVRERHEPKVAVVVSAMAGMTDGLLALIDRAAARDADYLQRLDALERRQLDTTAALLGADGEDLQADVASIFEEIRQVLKGVWLLRSGAGTARDAISGMGEVMNARLMARCLGAEARYLDARRFLQVSPGALGPIVDWEDSSERLHAMIGDAGLLVIPGFVAADAEGRTATLGRNGSDYSAAICARLLQAERLSIWTDVDGVMTADPGSVDEARRVSRLSYTEAMELAYFGAKVLHPRTLTPLLDLNVPVEIRNSARPEAEGTLISNDAPARASVKGISSIPKLSLVTVEGSGMIGIAGASGRVFDALNDAGVSVVMVSQASSEHSISVAVDAGHGAAARDALQRAFATEIQAGLVQAVSLSDGVSALAVVGDGMAGQPGVAARLFTALARANVNVKTIAQGAGERNLSVVVAAEDHLRALNAAHAAFYLAPKTIALGLIGPGNVGAELLQQMHAAGRRLHDTAGIDLRLEAVANSRHMVLGEMALDQAGERIAQADTPADLDRFAAHLREHTLPHAIIIDCSASQAVVDRYPEWLESGLHIVTPNKKSLTDSMAYYRRLREAQRSGISQLRYETTVGAALPVIETLRDLLATGDVVNSIGGIFSGTLAYLFNRFDGQDFGALVADARAQGLTEPDPRDDLSGLDVARKLVILGREIGVELELSDVQVESLIPSPLRDLSTDDFLQALPQYDDHFAERYRRAREAGQVLRYIGRIDAGGAATVGLESVDLNHPYANIALTDNIVEFRSRRYHANPLIVQGPGAGPEVTAAGVFADLLRLVSQLAGNEDIVGRMPARPMALRARADD